MFGTPSKHAGDDALPGQLCDPSILGRRLPLALEDTCDILGDRFYLFPHGVSA